MKTCRSLIALAAAVAAGLGAGCQSTPADLPLAENPSVTVYPVNMAGRADARVAAVVGLFLERGGLDRIEFADEPFAPDEGATFDEQAVAFGAFVREQDLATDYALFGAFLGTPGVGVDEVRGVIVDAEGRVAWSDRQTPETAAFREADPKDPMSCCVLFAQRLRGPLGLEDPMRDDAPEGPLAQRARKESLIPPEEEWARMEARVAKLHDAAPDATVLVYPARIGDVFSAEDARTLADRINRRGLMRATAAGDLIEFDAERDRNQQKILWSGARSIRELVREAQPEADYVLLVDYLMSPRGSVHAVHTYLLEPNGDWVIVDYQNSHHEDFNAVRPASADACGELATRRLASYLR